MVIIVGDKPSSKNIDSAIAFVGTTSYKKLLEWIYELDLDINNVVLCNKDQFSSYEYIKAYKVETKNLLVEVDETDKIIALGKNAAKYLNELKVSYFELPHPSGLNRKLNDRKKITEILKNCKEWLNG